MIIFASVNFNKILKKRKSIPGNVLTHARSVMPTRCGDMALYWRILTGSMPGSGLKDTDALSVERL